MTEDIFLGETVKYWVEIRDRLTKIKGFNDTTLIDEICELRGKLAFYEKRIEQMNRVMKESD